MEECVIKYKDNFYLKTEVGYKKIILTTDPQLIQDGIQAIDDEFLEWFVKNPSCEEVETIYGLFNPMARQVDPMNLSQNHSECVWKYKIIIPKEEPKQEFCDNCNNDICCCIVRTHETIEEAAEKYIAEDNNNRYYNDFIAGAKWQQEQMYSEEEVKKLIFDFYYDMSKKMIVPENLISENRTNVDEWFEQFKKK